MLAKRHPNDAAGRHEVAVESRFTSEEMAQLATLRERYQTMPDYGEYGLDLKRLAYVRYLVDKGILSEEC